MAAFGVSIPDDLAEQLDQVATQWRSNRSQAIVRIFLEWQNAQANLLPLAAIMPGESTSVEGRSVQSLPHFIPNLPAKPALTELAKEKTTSEIRHLGTGPGDEIEEV